MPHCPDDKSLQQLLSGQLPQPQSTELGEHLLSCDRCAAHAQTLSLDDELTAALRSPLLIEDQDPALQQAIAGSKELWSAESVVDEGDTKSLHVGRAPSQDDLSLHDSAAELAAAKALLAPSEQPNELGRLGNYRVLDLIGSGGMGMVFRAQDLKLERQVALKVLKPEMASDMAKQRFLQEAKAAAAIEHDHVVQIYQVGEERGVPFIAMQYLRGESLHDRLLREGELPQHEVLRIGREIASGLAAAHSCGLVHRDIKPHNIWLQTRETNDSTGSSDSLPRVKILDFGLVRSVETSASLTSSGLIVGTPRYMAPEQAKGEEIDARTDLFSVGSVMYHLLSGRPPFAGENVTSVLVAVASQEASPLDNLRSDIDPEVAGLVMRLLAKHPQERPQSAAELVASIAQLEQQTLHGASDSRLLAETTELRRPKVDHGVSMSGSPRSVITAIALVLLLIASGYGLWRAALLLRIDTGSGTLVVKVANDDFATEVHGQTITIQNLDTNEKYTIHLDSQENVRPDLPAGEYRFLLETDSGLQTRTDRFTLSKGKEEQVDVWWEPTTDMVQSSDDKLLPNWPADAPPLPEIPFGVEMAKQHQQVWASYLKQETNTTNSLGMQFSLIPPGRFTTPPGREVTLTKGYYLARHETTVAQFKQFLSDSGHSFPQPEAAEIVAIDSVSWHDASRFCQWLSEQEQTTYRLPTEAEWEWAVRAGSADTHFFGNEASLDQYSWSGINSDATVHAVGKLLPNAWGLYDVYGNVSEWVSDFHAPLSTGNAIDPSGPSSGSTHVIRGGDAGGNKNHTSPRPPGGFLGTPNFRRRFWGFRVLREINDQQNPYQPVQHNPDDLIAGLTPTSVNEFEKPNINLFANNSGMLREIRNDQHIVTCPEDYPSRGHWAWPVTTAYAGIIDVTGCVVTGELDARNPTAWLINLHDEESPHSGIVVKVSDKRVTYHESIFYQSPEDGPQRHDFILPEPIQPGAFHRVQLVIAEDKQHVTLYHDGKRIDGPIQLDSPLDTIRFSLGLNHSAHDQEGKVAFERYAFYPLPNESPGSVDTDALVFDGLNSYLEIPTLHCDGAQPLTLEAWIDSEPSEKATLFSQGTGSELKFEFDRGFWTMGLSHDGVYQGAGFPGKLEGRMHVAGVWDGDRMRVFVNGKSLPAGVAGRGPSSAPSTPNPIWLGAARDRSGKPTMHFHGAIEQVRISAAAKYIADFTPANQLTADDDTTALYLIDEGHGSRLADASGHGHEAIVHHARWRSAGTALSAHDKVPEVLTPEHGWIDLISQIVLSRDAEQPHWELTNGELLHTEQANDFLTLPIAISGDYEFRARFSRNDDQHSGFSFMLPIGDSHFNAQHFGFGRFHGISRVDGARFYKSDNPTSKIKPIAGEHEYETLLRVTSESDDRYRVVCTLDGQELYDYTGTRESVAELAYVLQPHCPTLFTGSLPVQRWHAIELRMLKGDARLQHDPNKDSP